MLSSCMTKMQNGNIDYAMYTSGSRAGTEKISALCDNEGSFDETLFEDANGEIYMGNKKI